MWQYFKFEWREFFTNRKNIGIYLLLLFFSLFYWLQIETQFRAIETVSSDILQASIDTKEHFLKTVNLEGETHPDTLAAVEMFPPLVENEKKQLAAIDKQDYTTLAKERSEWYILGANFHPLYFKGGNIYAQEEAIYARNGVRTRLAAYPETTKEVTLNMINEKTALQSLVRGSLSLFPLIFICLGIVFSMDAIAKDRRHKSLLKGLPISFGKRMLVKYLVVLSGVLIGVLPLAVGFIGIGIQNGFGTLKLPVTTSHYASNMAVMGDLVFESITIGEFLLKVFVLTSLLVLLVVGISLILGTWVKNAYFIFILMIGLPFIELFYNRFGYGDIHPIRFLPTSYVQVGDVVTGHRSFFFSDVGLTFETGVMVVGVSLCIVLVILACHSRFKKIL
ncbi:MAG: hypothetical protein RR968_06750 [Vagococcus sp.]